jgi:hypothetical protein
MVMKYLNIRMRNRDWPHERFVLNKGTTEPLEPKTLPKRVVMNFVAFTLSLFDLLIAGIEHISLILLLAPITLLGLTALSVETMTNFHIMFASQIGQVLVPSILVRMACDGFSSINGTCLYAAA